MIVLVTVDPERVTVEDAGNLRDLKVVVRQEVRSRLDDLLRQHRYGSFDGEHAWLDIEALRGAKPDVDHTWHTQFTAMIRYAAKQGWVSAEGGTVRAHCAESN